MQPAVQTRPFSNGFGRRKGEKETGTRLESRTQTAKTNSTWSTGVGKKGLYEAPSHDRLVYFSTCLLGHQVEVHVLDGSVFSGIFHATNGDKDFGIILKMAHLIKDGSPGRKNTSESLSKPPTKTMIVPGNELVQVTAKGVPATIDVFKAEMLREKQQELLTDSCISQSRHVEIERQLERWVPDDNALECPELDNIFDGHWNRGWDQFEANETLFGVKSTFDEDLYTTKLEKGPKMRELEKEASRIAREIEGEETRDFHLAEERGIQLHGNLEVDEETRYSAVVRGADDSGCDDCEDILLDSRNDETFQFNSTSSPFTGMCVVKVVDGAEFSSRPSTKNDVQSSKGVSMVDESRGQKIPFSEHDEASCNDEDSRVQLLAVDAQRSIPEDSKSSLRLKKETSEPDKDAMTGSSSGKGVVAPSKSPDIARSANSYGAGAASGNELSRSSSLSSFSSEKSTKSTLNPHAKEFKFNPNAKSYVPSQTTLRPASPVSDNSFYYPAGVPHMHGMPVGVGVGPPFAGHQPIFNPQAAPASQPYFHPSGPQYGQQMMIGHPRQVVYMPTYPPEMLYKGRDY